MTVYVAGKAHNYMIRVLHIFENINSVICETLNSFYQSIFVHPDQITAARGSNWGGKELTLKQTGSIAIDSREVLVDQTGGPCDQ